MLRTAKEILNNYVRRSWGYQQKDIISAINEAKEEAAIEFFKWNAKHESKYINHITNSTVEERYELFIKSIEDGR